MTRQILSQLCVSPLRLQQGMFASLAVMVTLMAGQQMQHWQQSQQQTPHFERPAMTQTHFSSIGSRTVGAASADVTAPAIESGRAGFHPGRAANPRTLGVLGNKSGRLCRAVVRQYRCYLLSKRKENHHVELGNHISDHRHCGCSSGLWWYRGHRHWVSLRSCLWSSW